MNKKQSKLATCEDIKNIQMDSKMNIWDKQQQNWIKEILSKSGTELKEISDKNGNNLLCLGSRVRA